MYIQNRHILSFLLILACNFCYPEDCTVINPDNYGTCPTMLGYVWSGEGCSVIYGCDMNSDDEFFFENFETCDLTCNPTAALGDVNSDNVINVVDIVALVAMILNDSPYLSSADINFDEIVNILDVVQLVNFILETTVPDSAQLFAGDMNADGNLNVQDIIILMNIILNQ